MPGLWVSTVSGWQYMPGVHALTGSGSPPLTARAVHRYEVEDVEEDDPEGDWSLLISLWVPSAADRTVSISQPGELGGPLDVAMTVNPALPYPEFGRRFIVYENGLEWQTFEIQGNSFQIPESQLTSGEVYTARGQYVGDGGLVGDPSPLSNPHVYLGA